MNRVVDGHHLHNDRPQEWEMISENRSNAGSSMYMGLERDDDGQSSRQSDRRDRSHRRHTREVQQLEETVSASEQLNGRIILYTAENFQHVVMWRG